jgi:PAS domain S-box-containing protein
MSPSLNQGKTLSELIISNDGRDGEGMVGDPMQNLLTKALDAKVESRLAVILEGIGTAFYSLGHDWRLTYINRAAQEYFGIPAQDMLGRVIWDVFPDSEGTDLRGRYEDVFRSGVAAAFESQAVSAPERILEFRVFPYDGGIAVSFRDRTEQRRAEEILREGQAQISALADNLPLGMVYQMDNGVGYDGRRFVYVSASCERLNGIPADKVPSNPRLLFDLILPEAVERVFRAHVESHQQLKPLDIEFPIRHAKTGEIRWQRIVDAPRKMPNGKIVWDGIQIDITDHKRAEEHLRLLINELNHRVKNTLVTVQSLSAQSFSRLNGHADQDVHVARSAFEARLFALARGHDVLTRENWEGAHLSDILNEACAPYWNHAAECNRIEIEGPNLRVPPPMALSLSMALHELFTNALKYGALSNASGRIRISWNCFTGSDGPRLAMRWEERDGPPVKVPSQAGFGSRLIEKGLARELNGSAHIAYEPEGVVCTIDVPLDTLLS